ncbi:MAG: 4-phosphoerythronate dehydrogenase PdxB [Phycisphaerae bacterium]
MIGSVKIVADENIPYVREAFGQLGKIELVGGRAITSALLKDADILLVRSVTRVDQTLLAGTQVKMVATATIGTDHIDEDYLHRSGITFSSAAGSNSNSVAEYITAALLTLAQRKKFTLAGKTIGVIGVGNVGSKVVHKCRQLGMTVLKNDPPVKDLTGSTEYCELKDFINTADFITLHVPLVVKGRYPTLHLVDEKFLGKMKPSAYLFNSSRGSVVDGGALKRALQAKRLAGAVLDVWENEPDIDVELLKMIDLGTPHIAGYSFDGKVNGTELIYQAACRFLGVKPSWNPKTIMPAPPVPAMSVACSSTEEKFLYPVIKTIYDIEADDARLREITPLSSEKRPKHFDQLRKHYPVRREFFNTRIEFTPDADENVKQILTGLGFQTT